MKYVVFMDNSVILFSESEDHKTMAADRPVQSAGFCCFETKRNQFDDIVCGEIGVWGESISLKVKCRPDDKDIIKSAIGRMI